MEWPHQLQQVLYATVGVGQWLWATARDGTERAWQNRDEWSGQAGRAYDDLANRGEGLLTSAGRQARQQARQSQKAVRRIPGVAAAEGEIMGLTGNVDELPVSDYDNRTAAQIASQLAGLSQRQLHQIEGYEASHQRRTTVLRRIEELRGQEPWPGYDEMNVDEILPRLRELPADERTALAVYEQRHKQRSTVVDTANATPQ